MQLVCHALSTAWDLPVLHTCGDSCQGECMGREIIAIGVRVILPDTGGSPMVHLQPATLASDRRLKWEPPLHAPALSASGYLQQLFLGVMQANLNVVRSCEGMLLSAAAWMQVAVLSGYTAQQVAGAMVMAVGRKKSSL